MLIRGTAKQKRSCKRCNRNNETTHNTKVIITRNKYKWRVRHSQRSMLTRWHTQSKTHRRVERRRREEHLIGNKTVVGAAKICLHTLRYVEKWCMLHLLLFILLDLFSKDVPTCMHDHHIDPKLIHDSSWNSCVLPLLIFLSASAALGRVFYFNRHKTQF